MRIAFPANDVFWSITSRNTCVISNGNTYTLMDIWSEKSLWYLYCGVGNKFMEHIKSHNPHGTILEVCAIQ